MKFSYRTRIATLFLIATASVVALAYIAIYWQVSRTVFAQLDAELLKEANEILKNVKFQGDQLLFLDPDEWKEKEHIQIEINPTFIQIVDQLGQVLHKTENLFNRQLIFHPEAPQTVFLDQPLANGMVRQIQTPIFTADGQIRGYVIVAKPLDEANMVLSNLSRVLMFSYPLILVLLFLVTRIIAGQSIRPIEQITATAERITHSNLNQRVPLPTRKDELYRLGHTINELLDRLEQAIKREKQFTADASHELRTPLAALKGTLEVVLRRPRSAEYYQEKIRYALREVNRLTHLVEQLLMLARYEAGDYQPEIRPVVLQEVCNRAMAGLKPMAQAHQVTVQLVNPDPLVVAADPDLLEIVLSNVISNAIKYSERGGRVTIDCWQDTYRVWCKIQDEGKGIPPDKLPHVFERFYRVDESRSSEVEGFGLGLAIVQRLADLMAFEVSLQSVEGVGTTVLIAMPTAETLSITPT